MMFHCRLRTACAAAVAALSIAFCATAAAFTPPPFPRIAGIQMGSPPNYNDPTYQAELAKQSLMILKDYPGLAPGSESMESIVKAIKARNPNALVFFYVQDDALAPSASSSDPWAEERNELNVMKWWLYGNGAKTQKVPSQYNPSNDVINNTTLTPKDSSGDDSVDWLTKYFVRVIYGPNPDIDGFFMDDDFVTTNVAGDWAGGSTLLASANSTASQDLREGYQRYFSLVHQLMPGKYQLANIGPWANGATIPSQYVDMANGGVLEGMIGKSWSIETWAGWQGMMQKYGAVMAALLQPKLAIFNQWGSPTDYQSFRYGLASCLMNDGYYSFTSASAGYTGVVWFDEYNANLGQAVSSPPTGPWQKGVWRRDFQNGIALVNPKGNGPQTVTLEAPFVKIKGTQDPAINSGQTVTTVTLKDRDGIILLRQHPLEQPKAPTQVNIQPGD